MAQQDLGSAPDWPDAVADGLGFALVGWVQVGIALLLLLGRSRRSTVAASLVANSAVLGLWVLSCTAGSGGGHEHGAEPEMLLYDGVGRDAQVVGLSCYVLHDSDAEPTQGFTGPNDHFHCHVGLCVGVGGVVGGSTTSLEDCEQCGGRQQQGVRLDEPRVDRARVRQRVGSTAELAAAD